MADNADYAHTFREVVQERGFTLWLPPTVAHELLHAVETKSALDGGLALTAIQHLLDWEIYPIGLDEHVWNRPILRFDDSPIRQPILSDSVVAVILVVNSRSNETNETRFLDVEEVWSKVMA